MEIKLAEALLRRKELAEKLNIVRQIKDAQLVYQIRPSRLKAWMLTFRSLHYPRSQQNTIM